MKVKFEIIGKIKSKQRPRATMINGHPRVYTPSDTINYENYVKMEYLRQVNYYFDDKPIRATIKAFYTPPQNISRYATYEKLMCNVSQDTDNVAKIVLDSLNKVAYKDDRQIQELHIEKKWVEDKKYERIEITLEDIEMWSIDKVRQYENYLRTLIKLDTLIGKEKIKGKLTKNELERKEKYIKEMESIPEGEFDL